MRLDTPTDVLRPEHTTTLLVGQVGIGKSSLVYSYERPVLLNFDHGAHRAANRRGHTLTFTSWADVQASFTRELVAEHRYTAVGVDTVERVIQLITAHVLERDPKAGAHGVLNQRGWGAVKLAFAGWIARVRSWGVDVLLVAHAKERRILAPRGSHEPDQVVIKPDIPGGSLDEAMKIADFCGYMHLRGDGARVIDFRQTPAFSGKGPLGVVVVPPVDRLALFLQELTARGRQALATTVAGEPTLINHVAAFAERLQSGSGVGHFNTLVDVVRALQTEVPEMVAAQIRGLLRKAASEAGLRWDDQLRAYVDTGVRPPAARPASSVPSVGVSRVNRAATWQPQLLSSLTEASTQSAGPSRVHSTAPAAEPTFAWGRS